MTIPKELADVIQRALAFVESDPAHNLILGYRQAIWAKFGPHLNASIPESSLAHQKRAFLAIQTVRHVLPLWEEKWPDDVKPHQIVDEAEQVLTGKLLFKDEEEGLVKYDEFWCYFDNKTHQDKSAANSYCTAIGYSAALSYYVTLCDENFDENDIDIHREDNSDPFEMDIPQLVAMAYANGTVADQNSDKLKRKAFWEWWLTEAVPKAWS